MSIRTAGWGPLDGAAQAVALEVLLHGPLPRSELARRLDLSPGSLTRLTKPLLESNLLIETGERYEAKTGRPTRPLDVVPTSHHFLGVKLTADAAHAVVTTMRALTVASAEVPLPDSSPSTVAATVGGLLTRMREQVGDITAMGISLGGQVIDHDLVTSARYLDWRDVRFASLMREATGIGVVVDNDLMSLVRAEQWFGAALGCDHFAVLTIGEGIGYGLVVHDRVIDRPDAGVGLLGHFPLDPHGPLCPDGHPGCADAMLTIGSLRNRVAIGLGRAVTYDECLDLAAAGDPIAVRVTDDSAHALGRLIAAVGNLTMPKKIILSGDGVRLAEIARPAWEAGLARDRSPRAEPLDITIRRTGFAEWARGAAVTAIQTFVLGH